MNTIRFLKPARIAMHTTLVVCILLAITGQAYAAKTFKVSNQFPTQHHVSKGLHFFAAKVHEHSNGNLTAQIYDSGQLFRDAEIVRAIRNGSTEVGLVPVNKWSGIIPAVDIFEVPFAFKSLPALKEFLDSGAASILDAEFSKYGVQVLLWIDYGYVQFFNSIHPIKSPEDMKGMSIRAFSAGDADILKALGASPTVISSSELYMALQHGTVSGTTTGMPAAISRKVTEVQKYMTLCNYSTAEFIVQANGKWWKKLTDEERDVINRAAKDAEAFIREAVGKAEEEALATIKSAGIQVHVTTEEERTAFMQSTLPLYDMYLKKAGENGPKLLELIKALK